MFWKRSSPTYGLLMRNVPAAGANAPASVGMAGPNVYIS
jgi:hypothetical protein